MLLRGDMIQIFKIICDLENIPSERFFRISTSTTRGHNFKLEKSHCKTSMRLHQFSQRIISN